MNLILKVLHLSLLGVAKSSPLRQRPPDTTSLQRYSIALFEKQRFCAKDPSADSFFVEPTLNSTLQDEFLPPHVDVVASYNFEDVGDSSFRQIVLWEALPGFNDHDSGRIVGIQVQFRNEPAPRPLRSGLSELLEVDPVPADISKEVITLASDEGVTSICGTSTTDVLHSLQVVISRGMRSNPESSRHVFVGESSHGTKFCSEANEKEIVGVSGSVFVDDLLTLRFVYKNVVVPHPGMPVSIIGRQDLSSLYLTREEGRTAIKRITFWTADDQSSHVGINYLFGVILAMQISFYNETSPRQMRGRSISEIGSWRAVKETTLSLAEDEKIIKVCGATGDWIDRLKFTTDRQRDFDVGSSSGGVPFCLEGGGRPLLGIWVWTAPQPSWLDSFRKDTLLAFALIFSGQDRRHLQQYVGTSTPRSCTRDIDSKKTRLGYEILRGPVQIQVESVPDRGGFQPPGSSASFVNRCVYGSGIHNAFYEDVTEKEDKIRKIVLYAKDSGIFGMQVGFVSEQGMRPMRGEYFDKVPGDVRGQFPLSLTIGSNEAIRRVCGWQERPVDPIKYLQITTDKGRSIEVGKSKQNEGVSFCDDSEGEDVVGFRLGMIREVQFIGLIRAKRQGNINAATDITDPSNTSMMSSLPAALFDDLPSFRPITMEIAMEEKKKMASLPETTKVFRDVSSGSEIESLTIWSGSDPTMEHKKKGVFGIQLAFRDEVSPRPRRSAYDFRKDHFFADEAVLSLGRGERIVRICRRSGEWLDYLNVTTSKGQTMQAGPPTGGSEQLCFDSDTIVGLYGGYVETKHLMHIGVVYAKELNWSVLSTNSHQSGSIVDKSEALSSRGADSTASPAFVASEESLNEAGAGFFDGMALELEQLDLEMDLELDEMEEVGSKKRKLRGPKVKKQDDLPKEKVEREELKVDKIKEEIKPEPQCPAGPIPTTTKSDKIKNSSSLKEDKGAGKRGGSSSGVGGKPATVPAQKKVSGSENGVKKSGGKMK